MYKVTTFRPKSPLAHTTVSFSLSYLDWCQLEKSEEWEAFRNLLEEVQNTHSRMSSADQTDLLVNDLEKRVIEECAKLKKEANPKTEMQNYIRQIAWEEPELAAYLQKRMSQILNFND